MTGFSPAAYEWEARFWRCSQEYEPIEDITDLVVAASIDSNLDRSVRQQLSLDLIRAEAIERFVDHVAPIIRRYRPDGTYDEHPFGLYTFESPRRVIDWSTTRGEWQGYDLTVRLENSVVVEPYTVEAGEPVVDAVTALVADAGLTRIAIDPTTETLGSTRTWPPGTTRREITNDLLAAIGYYALYPTPTGVLISHAMIDKAAAAAWRAIDAADLFEAIVETPNYDRVRNVIIIRRQDAADEVWSVTVRNDDPQSPWSTVNIGERPEIIDDPDIADEAAAIAMADNLLALAGSYYVTLDLVLLLDPTIWLHQTIDLTFINAAGTDLSGRYWIRTWDWGFDAEHDVMRVQVHQLRPVGV